MDMKEAKIITFGNVTEHHDGRLKVSCFNIEGGDRFKDTPSDVVILTLIKERIEKEIAQLIK